ncbi:DUF1501 domain-containing protein [Urbifossiella limnaea]|uniref:DUF1501 domain-containing protein n=1 Tax=Urbifossiella limnaea TaxID=2528023 RepID=A0A517XSP7_9BACT|nr:DUF1501 domain-containing protein [Urbifossiella limnaea]QDU20536.1 hypothetical protein ETAA1_24900 [Urbifossiella limnaea]
MPTFPHTHRTGLTRREAVQVGYSGLLGLGMAASAPAQSGSSRRKPNSVILVFLTGAASQLETFDPKPDNPAEIRGEFGTVATPVAGVRLGEHLPLLAARANKYALVRTLAHTDNNHTAATHHLITGAKQPGVRFDKPLSRDDYPVYGAGLAYLRPRSDGVPAAVTLPTFLADGPLVWPGQHAGFLGPRYDPFQVTQDPNLQSFKLDNLRPTGIDVDQLRDRAALLDAVNAQRRSMTASAEGRRLSDSQQHAITVLTSGRVATAFEMEKEPAATRDRYGRHSFGQSLLLARRLVESGVSVVQANMGRVQNWDHHSNIFPTMRRLLPPLDAGVSALLDDLGDRGLLETTMVVVVGDFGRTPKVINAGRDHWAPCFSALFAGAGVRPGVVVGRSDKTSAYPATTPYSPDDLGATVYHALGVDPHSEVRDRLDRPVQLNRGEVIQPLFTGA